MDNSCWTLIQLKMNIFEKIRGIFLSNFLDFLGESKIDPCMHFYELMTALSFTLQVKS